jgi:outer membrane scaffolding protein for murein synthesis (MipA/OmpV family)
MRRSVRPILIFFAVLFSLSLGTAAFAVEEPVDPPEGKALWEFGLFNAAARIPDYRGSDEYQTYVLPLPYVIYRGRIIQADREGVRGIFFRTDRWESSFSAWGNPPVDEDNDDRRGMPELDAIFEFGPAIRWYFLGRDFPDSLYAQASIRAASSIDFGELDVGYEGIHGAVNLVYDNTRLLRDLGIGFGANLGLDVADDRFNGYFYDVDPAYATPDRPAFSAGGGYGGFSLAVNARKRLTKSLSFGVYSRWENSSGAAFEDSPLVGTENNFTIGCALTWKIWESEARAPVD